MVSGTLARFIVFFSYCWAVGQSPVEWGDFPSIHPFIRPIVCPPL